MPTWNSTIAKIWSESQKAAAGPLPFALFICGLLAYGGTFAWHTLTNFDLINLIRDANYDDAFYYFQIAYNLSQGKFSTFDGGITQTNGYHPVWLLLITPFYWLFDKETALFGIKAFEIMLIASGAALIAVAARMARLAWPLLFAALPMLYHNHAGLLFGMEAAAAMFALAMLILAACLYMREPQRWKWTLAALAFALPWARIEYIAISLAVTVALCAIEWSRQERRAPRLSALANMRHPYIPLIGAISGILLYFAYNKLAFGGILPISAVVGLAWSQARVSQEGGYDFIQSFLETLKLNVFDYELLIALEICVYLLIAWRLALRSKERRDWLLVAFLAGMFGLAAGHLAKFAQIVLIMPYHGSNTWYFVPAYMMAALIIPIRLYVAIYLIRRFLAPRRRAAANALNAGVVAIGAAVLLATAGFAAPFKWVDQASRSSQLNWGVASYMGAQVMNHALPDGSVIGSWDSGVLGYFSRIPVVNLDGLVNSYEYINVIRQDGLALMNAYDYFKIMQQDGLGLGKYVSLADPRVEEISRRYGVTHFANTLGHEPIPNNLIFESAPFDVWKDENLIRIWTYDPPPETQGNIDYSQQIWDNMKPHFDHSTDGFGVLFAGRTAQAFAIDCATDKPLIWTWRQQERTVRLEAMPYQTRTGMCVDSRILPHSAPQTAKLNSTTSDDRFSYLTADREPIIRSNFNVYLIDRSLIFAKTQCRETDVKPTFFANIFPINADDLPKHLRQRGYYTINFNFHDYGAFTLERVCRAAIELPNYPISEIHAGQYVTTDDGYYYAWEETYKTASHADSLNQDLDFATLADREPIIRSHFNVYIIGERLIFAKSQCSQSDVDARFFASLFHAYPDTLPSINRLRGYESIDFEFARYGRFSHDGRCWAAVKLPNYHIAKIHAGQYVTTDDGYQYPWESTYRFK